MDLIEKLDYIIPVKLLNTAKGYGLKIVSTPPKTDSICFYIDHKNKEVLIYRIVLTFKETRKLKAILYSEFEEDKLFFIVDIKIDLLTELYDYNAKNKDGYILVFFKDILAKNDFFALRDSLFLRSRFVLKEFIGDLKYDIRCRYGERGNSISNLCTAGYFENIMIPLYNNNPTEFHSYYDLAVERGITALFVSSKMKNEEIKSEINRRIKSAKSYGQLKTFHIHGMGKTNINNINKCISELKKETDIKFTEKKVNVKYGIPILVVEIIL